VAAAWCFAGFFALWPYFSAVTVSGMESPLMLALIALGAALAARAARGADRRSARSRSPARRASPRRW
jgi:hypothetical protein